MIFTRDFVTRENYWQIASLVTQKSLFTVIHALFLITCNVIQHTHHLQTFVDAFTFDQALWLHYKKRPVCSQTVTIASITMAKVNSLPIWIIEWAGMVKYFIQFVGRTIPFHKRLLPLFRRKLRLNVAPLLTIRSQQFFAHATTVQLSFYVKKCSDRCIRIKVKVKRIFHRIAMEKPLVK